MRFKRNGQHLFLGVSDESVELDQPGEDSVLRLCGRPHLHCEQCKVGMKWRKGLFDLGQKSPGNVYSREIGDLQLVGGDMN